MISCAGTLSFVLPIHNEQESLEALYLRLSAVMDELGETCEALSCLFQRG